MRSPSSSTQRTGEQVLMNYFMCGLFSILLFQSPFDKNLTVSRGLLYTDHLTLLLELNNNATQITQ